MRCLSKCHVKAGKGRGEGHSEKKRLVKKEEWGGGRKKEGGGELPH
jgi:hypothetical protein